MLSAGTGYVGEGQTEVLQVSKGARAQQASQVSVLQRAAGLGQCWAAQSSPSPEPSCLLSQNLTFPSPVARALGCKTRG